MNKSLKVVTSALLVPLVDNLGISSTNQLTLVKPESWIADSSIFFRFAISNEYLTSR